MINKYREEGENLKNKYKKDKNWSDDRFRKELRGRTHELKRTLKTGVRIDFVHELILLYSDVSGNMYHVSDILKMEDWQKAGYAFLVGFY